MRRKVLMLMLLMVFGVVVNAETKSDQKAVKSDQKVEKTAQKAEKTAQNAEKSAQKAEKQTSSLADARGHIDRAIESPKVMEKLMGSLSAADQKQFLADVNKAIADMPASTEEKTALFLNANSAAMRSAAPGNLQPMVAEVFATVPPESLTVVAERFAIDLFNRDAAGAGKYTDEQFTRVATETMKVVNERTALTDNGSARSAFAIIMFVRSANNSIPELADALIGTLEHADAQEMARNEWVPSALGKDGRTQGYEPLLASADAGRRPDQQFVLVIAGPQHLESLLSDLVGKNTDPMAFIDTRTAMLDAVENKLVQQNPVLGADEPSAGGTTQPDPEKPEPKPTPDDPDPVPPYDGQSM